MNTRSLIASAWGAPIGVLGGLIGLGGGEFRIPILMRVFALGPKAVIPVNATISLFTLAASLAFRAGTLSWSALPAHALDIAALAVGGIVSAIFDADVVKRMSGPHLHRWIVILLVALGLLLIGEGLIGEIQPLGMPSAIVPRLLIGLGLGIAIGAIATILGVAGGELLIPTLVFLYGVDIKTAGTASLLISLAVVATGLIRFRVNGMLPDRATTMTLALPMAAGSVAGAALGAYLAAFADGDQLKILLGALLLTAAAVSSRQHQGRSA